MDIEIINGELVCFKKKLWHETEILLARCFFFDVDINTGTIISVIKFTAKRSLYEFIKLSFKNFSESPLESDRRNDFYAQLSKCYDHYNGIVEEQIKLKLPYYASLYSHQSDTIKESYYKQYNFYALEMGLGKSLTAASLSRLHKCKRTVIFCPAAVKFNWYRDLIGFEFNELYFTMLDSRKSRGFKALMERFVIVNYDIADKFLEELLSSPIDHFILDEAQNLKNHNTAKFKAVKKIVDANLHAKITLLSGTPIVNRINDAFAYLKLIGHELGANYTKFLKEYTITSTIRGNTKVSGGKNLQDLYVKLSNLMIRKTKAQCLDLPEKIFFNYRYDLDDYREQYDNVIKELSEAKEISTLTGNLHSLNIITSKAKLKGIIEIAEEILEQGRKVVIFGSYTAPIEELEKYFGNKCVKIVGSVDAYTRDQHVQKFHNDETCKVVLANMIAGGVGINLTNSSDVIFINFPFVPAHLHQATDRLHRIGQKSCVNVHYTFCTDSVDEYIWDILMDKSIDINSLIDNGKEEIERGSMVEILIKKLLKRDDINFKTHHAKVVAEIQEAKVEEISLGKGWENSISDENDFPNFD